MDANTSEGRLAALRGMGYTLEVQAEIGTDTNPDTWKATVTAYAQGTEAAQKDPGSVAGAGSATSGDLLKAIDLAVDAFGYTGDPD